MEKWFEQFNEEDIQIANKQKGKYSTQLVIRKMQINTTVGSISYQLRMAKYKRQNNQLIWEVGIHY
jgi:hypothetical protein